MTGRTRRLLRGLVTPLAAFAVVFSLSAPASTAAPTNTFNCTVRPNEPHTDWTNMHFTGDMWCSLTPGSIRLQSRSTSGVNGRALYTPRWFVCWKRGSMYGDTGSDIWYYTQGDQVVSSATAKAWGYMPAALVNTGLPLTKLDASGKQIPGDGPTAAQLKVCPWTGDNPTPTS